MVRRKGRGERKGQWTVQSKEGTRQAVGLLTAEEGRAVLKMVALRAGLDWTPIGACQRTSRRSGLKSQWH